MQSGVGAEAGWKVGWGLRLGAKEGSSQHSDGRVWSVTCHRTSEPLNQKPPHMCVCVCVCVVVQGHLVDTLEV